MLRSYFAVWDSFTSKRSHYGGTYLYHPVPFSGRRVVEDHLGLQICKRGRNPIWVAQDIVGWRWPVQFRLCVHQVGVWIKWGCASRGDLRYLPGATVEVSTWRILPWSEVHSTTDLLAMHARQLNCLDDGFEEATLHLQRMRLKEKERHGENGIRDEELVVGDMSRKLAFKWLRPYQTCDAVKNKGTYML